MTQDAASIWKQRALDAESALAIALIELRMERSK